MQKNKWKDYSLVGPERDWAVSKGLASGIWYYPNVSKLELQSLLIRRNWPGLRDTLLWFGLIFGFGFLGYLTWGTYWTLIPFALYGVMYASTSDSRWHESSHGTVFKTDWLNNILYEISSFMVFRESIPWRYSHVRHHSDTSIVGMDPEIAVPRPPNFLNIFCAFFALRTAPMEIKKMFLHAMGKMTEAEKEYVPNTEFPKVYRKARIYLSIYFFVIGLSILSASFLPLMYIGLPTLYGTWLLPIYGLTQHAGLAENVLDHRLNSRTVKLNIINRFLYWNMNYHIEHHMYPMVPYHHLNKLHQLIKNELPKPYNGIWECFKEIIPGLIKQNKDPQFFVKRKLPAKNGTGLQKGKIINVQNTIKIKNSINKDGWVQICESNKINRGGSLKIEINEIPIALFKTEKDKYYATEGMCTHGKSHLADGLLIGETIECSKHNGRFNVRDGSIVRRPACIPLKTHKVKTIKNMVLIKMEKITNQSSENVLLNSNS